MSTDYAAPPESGWWDADGADGDDACLTMIFSQASLGRDWLSAEDEAAWEYLEELQSESRDVGRSRE